MPKHHILSITVFFRPDKHQQCHDTEAASVNMPSLTSTLK